MKRVLQIISAALFVAIMMTGSVDAEERLIGVPITELGNKYQLLGRLEIPLGTMATVQGVVAQGPFKGFEGGPILRVQRIDGQATQKDIRINLDNYGHQYELHEDSNSKKIPRKLVYGKTYEIYGHETGEFIGDPNGFVRDVSVQTVGYYLRESFYAEKGRQIEPIPFVPADFVDREALLEGRAVTRNGQSLLTGKDWKLLVDAQARWPADIENKPVEALGIIRKTDQSESFRLENGTTRLVRLEDQVGRKVELRGEARSQYPYWWFVYRGIELHVDNMEKLVNNAKLPPFAEMSVQGTLDEAMLPDLDELSEAKPPLKKQFVVRNATIAPLKQPLLAPERPKVESW